MQVILPGLLRGQLLSINDYNMKSRRKTHQKISLQNGNMYLTNVSDFIVLYGLERLEILERSDWVLSIEARLSWMTGMLGTAGASGSAF